MPHQYVTKIFFDLCKKPQPLPPSPTYLMYGPLLVVGNGVTWDKSSLKFKKFKRKKVKNL